MKKVLCTSLLAAALLVQPVSGSDSSVTTADLRMAASGSSAWDDIQKWIPQQARRLFDQIRPDDKPARTVRPANAAAPAAGSAPTRLAATAPARTNLHAEAVVDAPGKASDPEQNSHWPLLLGALLLMGMIVRRRTAVK